MQRTDSLEKTLMLGKIEGRKRRGWEMMRSSNTLATWCEELTRWKRHWCWERLKAGREGDERWWEAPILWLPDVKNWLIGKDTDAGKHWRQEKKGMREDEMTGWDELASPIWLAWLWTGSGSWWWTWKPSIHGITKSQTQRSNWTELKGTLLFLISKFWIIESVSLIIFSNIQLWWKTRSRETPKMDLISNLKPNNLFSQTFSNKGDRNMTDKHFSKMQRRQYLSEFHKGTSKL